MDGSASHAEALGRAICCNSSLLFPGNKSFTGQIVPTMTSLPPCKVLKFGVPKPQSCSDPGCLGELFRLSKKEPPK